MGKELAKEATTEHKGLMSAEDKEKLNAVIPNAYVEGPGTIPLCFAYVGWRTEFKEITVQKFNGISDTSIILYSWDGETKTNITLQYSDAVIDELKYTWKTDQYTIIVDFGCHSSEERIQTSTKSTFLFKNKCFLIKDFSDAINGVNHKVEDLTKASKEAGKYISTEGKILNTSVSDIYLSEMVEAEVGTVIVNARPIPSAEGSYIHFYDSELNYLSYISEAVLTVAEKILTSNDIPAAAKYMRVALRESGYVVSKSLIGTTDIINISKSETDKLRKIPKQQGYYINVKGDIVKTSVAAFWLSSYAYAEVGVIIRNAKPVPSASNSYIHFYDSNFNHLSYIASSGTAEIAEVTITEEDIPVGARYMRAEVTATGDVYAKTLINLDDFAPKTLGVPFDYATALSMDKNVLRNAVEAASAGKCTVLYDNDGYPSLMYRVPVMSVGAFSQDLGDFATPHPAFVVGGVKKNEIYISVFQTCVYNGHYVSWFGLPSIASLGITELRQSISAKGEGWHLETIYERSLLGLLTLKYNSPTPRGNTCWGRSSVVGFEYECAKMYNGKLPGNAASGEGEQINGALWINGTQPHTWSHNNTEWGIQDVIGGYHEICDLVKMVDGFLYMPNDNNYSADESTWVNTGVAIDVITGKGNIFSNSITSSISASDLYVSTPYDKVECTEGYNTLSEDIRKKMTLLLLAPRLLSSDTDTVLGINGVIQSRPAGVGYIVMGGAEEYVNSGLGYYNIAYDLSTVATHNNMGSRMAYIK